MSYLTCIPGMHWQTDKLKGKGSFNKTEFNI